MRGLGDQDLLASLQAGQHFHLAGRAAAELHRLESWRSRTAYVRDLAARHGIAPRDTCSPAGWRLRMFGKTAIKKV